MPSNKDQLSSNSHYHVSTLIRREGLTHDTAIKPVMSVELQLSEEDFVFEAGDAIKIFCANDENEVNLLLQR
ncbi:unnamed protein product [Rotaria sp. Silwood1]|nr:unnamed protein product [Rotaria sp. Silwood1]